MQANLKVLDENYSFEDEDISHISGIIDPNILEDIKYDASLESKLIQCPTCDSKCTDIKEFGNNKVLTCNKNHIWLMKMNNAKSVELKQVHRCPVCLNKQINMIYISNYKLHRCSNDHMWGSNIRTNQTFELTTESKTKNYTPFTRFLH